MFGVFVNLQGRRVVVVGSGPVGRRKAQALRAAGAKVRIVSLDVRPDDADDAMEWLTEPYEQRHLDDAALVFAAATPEVNARVVADARLRGVWVCDAANPDDGDFITPASIRRGDVVVAVSTGVPALTRALRERMEEWLDPAWAEWVAILTDLRPRILAMDEERQAALWAALTEPTWLARLAERGAAAVREEMQALLWGERTPL